jgi:biopolymer transport protein ExbD
MPARRHRPSREASVPTDSLSDVAFLLIIFFILTTSIQRITGVVSDMPAAQHTEQTSSQEKMPSIKLRDGALTLDDQPVSIEELRAKLLALNLPSRAEADRVIVLEATGLVNYQQYYEVMAAVSAASGVLGVIAEQPGGGR